MVEIEKPAGRKIEKRRRNLLAERGHQAKLRLPLVQEQRIKLWRFNSTSEHRQTLLGRKTRDEQFILSTVRVFPQADVGVRKWLSWVVSGDTGDLNVIRQCTTEEFFENMVAAHETPKDSDACFSRDSGRLIVVEAERVYPAR